MKGIGTITCLAVLNLGLFHLGRNEDPAEWLREGNEAFGREEYPQAADCYQRAEERAGDPGLVAFNEGAALYRMGQYREAIARYERCLNDATGARRARALFGLGNSLLHQGGSDGQRPLERAIACYRACLRQDGADPDLLEDATHNLELAKLLWLQARPDEHNRSQDQSDDQDPTRPQSPRPQPSLDPGELGDGGRRPDQGQDRVQAQPQPGRQPIPTDDQGAAGAGQLPPIPDKDELVPLDPEAAAEHLRRAGERLLRAERERAERAKAPAGALDR